MSGRISLRKAKIADASAIKRLIDSYAARNLMLPRSLNNILENIRDFTVAEAENRVVGCVALHVVWTDLAEVRSLAVEEEHSGSGIGSALVRAALKEAAGLGAKRVFTLTYTPDFFSKLGFTELEKQELPHKIWKDCLECSRFPDCDETAMITTISREE